MCSFWCSFIARQMKTVLVVQLIYLFGRCFFRCAPEYFTFNDCGQHGGGRKRCNPAETHGNMQVAERPARGR